MSQAHCHSEVACLEHLSCTEVTTCAKQKTECFLRGDLGLDFPYCWLLCLSFQMAFMFRWLGFISRKTHKIRQQSAFRKWICKIHAFIEIACEVWKPKHTNWVANQQSCNCIRQLSHEIKWENWGWTARKSTFLAWRDTELFWFPPWMLSRLCK